MTQLEQGSLLDLAPAHRNDPPESLIAASRVNAQHQLVLVMRCLAAADEPLTDDEIADRCDLLRHSAGTRRGVAVRMKLVERVGRGVSALGNPAGTWSITAAGRAWLKEIDRG